MQPYFLLLMAIHKLGRFVSGGGNAIGNQTEPYLHAELTTILRVFQRQSSFVYALRERQKGPNRTVMCSIRGLLWRRREK